MAKIRLQSPSASSVIGAGMSKRDVRRERKGSQEGSPTPVLALETQNKSRRDVTSDELGVKTLVSSGNNQGKDIDAHSKKIEKDNEDCRNRTTICWRQVSN